MIGNCRVINVDQARYATHGARSPDTDVPAKNSSSAAALAKPQYPQLEAQITTLLYPPLSKLERCCPVARGVAGGREKLRSIEYDRRGARDVIQRWRERFDSNGQRAGPVRCIG